MGGWDGKGQRSMDYRKVDAGLAAALDEVRDPEERGLTVFIHTAHAPEPAEVALLERFAISGIRGGRTVFTAILSMRDVAELSDQPWIQSLKLSKTLHLLSEV